MNRSLFERLQARGYLYQCTDLSAVRSILESDQKITFYLGIDPTADSLHIGHFFALMLFRYLQEAGHHGIVVIGGATAMIGDPSGKRDMRKMLTREQVQHNLAEVKALVKRFVRTDGENPARILNNADWINPYSFVDFMRMVGVHFNVNTMLSAEAYANRLQQGGLTFLEMGYMLMQAYDFVYLHETYGCVLQIGGSDQWGNIVAGTTLNRKMHLLNEGAEPAEEANRLFGLTCPLLLTKDGRKMGKTEAGTLWVAREKTTAFDFYQYFYNVDDADVENLMLLFTRIPEGEIRQLIETDILQAKRRMACEITALVHGQEAAEQASAAARALFEDGSAGENAPESDFQIEGDAIGVVELACRAGFAESRSAVRRLIQQNGLYIDGKTCASIDAVIPRPPDRAYVLLRKGKKTYLKVRFAEPVG